MESQSSKLGAWHPIDTPPPEWIWVLVYAAASHTSATHMVARWDGSSWESADDGYQPYMNPTHWMLLPSGPSA